jgi:predicted  nucleic acid-binding Zn-ribbon protein
MAGRLGFLGYVKRAFLFKWNLLVLGAATVAGVISGRPDVALPIVAAGELLFLGMLSANPKFQDAIDAAEHKAKSADDAVAAEARRRAMLEALPREDRAAYERLRRQCVELRAIASRVTGETETDVGGARPGAGLQASGTNRLLWIYLKLLYSKSAVERFFHTIDVAAIEDDISRAEERLAALGPAGNDTPTNQRRRASLQDQIDTSRLRLENHKKARENYEFIKDELVRLSTKIAGLSELSINRQDPNFITSEVDSVAASVQTSEQAMSELDFLTGFGREDEPTPELLDEPLETEGK